MQANWKLELKEFQKTGIWLDKKHCQKNWQEKKVLINLVETVNSNHLDVLKSKEEIKKLVKNYAPRNPVIFNKRSFGSVRKS